MFAKPALKHSITLVSSFVTFYDFPRYNDKLPHEAPKVFFDALGTNISLTTLLYDHIFSKLL